MTNWLEEKEKGLERLEQECADCVCCRDFECRLTDRKIEKIKAEIKAYKRGVADTENYYFGGWNIGDETWVIFGGGIFHFEITGFTEKGYVCCHELNEQSGYGIGWVTEKVNIFKTEQEAQAELERLKNE